MFQVNDLVVFGTHGICKIKAIGSLNMSSADEDRLYYTLKPLYETQQSAVYTPVDNLKAPIRAACTREEALEIIDRIPEIETVWVLDERQREGKYKEIMLKNDCIGWLQIIKTLYLKRQKRLAEGKKSTSKDDLYFKLAEDLLYGELASALEMDREAVKDIIAVRVNADENK
ncbi:CarD family transcriptional regulator [Lachnospiraceae bacterium 54-53]